MCTVFGGDNAPGERSIKTLHLLRLARCETRAPVAPGSPSQWREEWLFVQGGGGRGPSAGGRRVPDLLTHPPLPPHGHCEKEPFLPSPGAGIMNSIKTQAASKRPGSGRVTARGLCLVVKSFLVTFCVCDNSKKVHAAQSLVFMHMRCPKASKLNQKGLRHVSECPCGVRRRGTNARRYRTVRHSR